MASYDIAGNQCIFCMFKLFNILLVVEGLLVIGMGVWLWVTVKQITLFSIIFMGLGLFECLLCILGAYTKKSKYRLKIYIFFLLIIFLSQLTATICTIALKDKMINILKENLIHDQKSEEQINSIVVQIYKDKNFNIKKKNIQKNFF